MVLDEIERERKFPLARGFIRHPHQLAALAADPAAAVEARTEIGAAAELADDFEQRLLHAQLAAELDKGGDAVADELRYGEAGVELELIDHRVVVGADVAGVAAHARARTGDADLEERLAEIVAPSDVGNEPVRGAVAGMHVGVDEARRHQFVARVDLTIDRAREALADE
jgi:hypothetical protein